MHLYHLSHIDLDGYACQWVAKQFIQTVRCYNTNYGPEILAHIDAIFDHINAHQMLKNNILLLITDVNLTLKQCQYIQQKIEQSHCIVDIQLLDHHITGLEASECYEWYHLEEDKCATRLTYEYLSSQFEPLSYCDKKSVLPFVNMVNSVDMWLESEHDFEFGKVCMQMIAKSNELPKELFSAQDVAYKHHLLDSAVLYIDKPEATIALDENLYFIKKKYLNTTDHNDTFDNVVANHIVSLLEQDQERLTIDYKSVDGEHKKALLSFGLQSISILANLFLKRHPEIDFFINVSRKGNISMRSNHQADVSQIATIHFGGGGHKNASGGVIEGYKPCFSYDKVKKQVIACLQHDM